MWKDKLNKKERKHLKENKIKTKHDMKEQIKFIKKEFRKPGDKFFVCFECIGIAEKLGWW